eukprot:765368-Hanusia_phi.AAC.3
MNLTLRRQGEGKNLLKSVKTCDSPRRERQSGQSELTPAPVHCILGICQNLIGIEHRQQEQS